MMVKNQESQTQAESSVKIPEDFPVTAPSSVIPPNNGATTTDLHKQFLLLGRERNKITYKLLALLPQIYKQKVYSAHGYATIYEYAGKLAGLSHSTVEKALKLEEKLKDKPCLQKAIETQGIHKVAIIANLATPENEKMFADKVENMSKPALQQFSKELRGKIQTTWNIEMDEEMMTMFLRIKKEMKGENLSNKEAMRRILRSVTPPNGGVTEKGETTRKDKTICGMMVKNKKPQAQAETTNKTPGDFSVTLTSTTPVCNNNNKVDSRFRGNDNEVRDDKIKITRYIPVAIKREVIKSSNNKCSHPNCHNPIQIFHHKARFSQSHNHDSLISLCKIHHEFAHNGITENLSQADELYRKYRQGQLL